MGRHSLNKNKSTLFNEGDITVQITDKPVALEFPIELEFWNVDFWGGRITGEPGEKPSEQGREPTTNSTHIWRRVRESNPGHIGGRRALSPLRHPLLLDPYLLHLASALALGFGLTMLNLTIYLCKKKKQQHKLLSLVLSKNVGRLWNDD